MANRRKYKRKKTRVKVRYGEDELTERGRARDMSLGGMFLDCRRPPPKGTQLHLHLEYEDREFYLEAVVVHQKLVNPQLRQVEKQGVGLRFLTPDELVSGVIPKDERVRLTNTVVCEEVADVRKILDEQLAARVLVVPIASAVPSQGDVVEFEIEVEVGEPSTIDGQGRVVQLLGDGDERQAVLEVRDADKLRKSLEASIA